MPSDTVLTETLSSFAITGDATDESPAIVPQRKRKLSSVKNDEKVGRSRFAGDVCADHPEWEHDDGTTAVAIPRDFPCAKFSGLPGKGKGIKQPSIGTILRQTTFEFVRPLMLIAMLVGGLYGFQHVVLHGNGGFHLLRPGSGVSQPTGGMSNSGEHATPSAVPSGIRSNPHRNLVNSPSVPAHPGIKK